jgi:hypothetical protein
MVKELSLAEKRERDRVKRAEWGAQRAAREQQVSEWVCMLVLLCRRESLCVSLLGWRAVVCALFLACSTPWPSAQTVWPPTHSRALPPLAAVAARSAAADAAD